MNHHSYPSKAIVRSFEILEGVYLAEDLKCSQKLLMAFMWSRMPFASVYDYEVSEDFIAFSMLCDLVQEDIKKDLEDLVQKGYLIRIEKPWVAYQLDTGRLIACFQANKTNPYFRGPMCSLNLKYGPTNTIEY